jgi:PleD family two-component response regulator
LAIHDGENVNGARTVTVSIGVATAFSRSGGTMKMPEGLLLAADNALYKAKGNGPNRLSTSVLLSARDDVSPSA